MRKRTIAGVAALIGMAIAVPATAAFAMNDHRRAGAPESGPPAPVTSTDSVEPSVSPAVSDLPSPAVSDLLSPAVSTTADAPPIVLHRPAPDGAPPPLPIAPHRAAAKEPSPIATPSDSDEPSPPPPLAVSADPVDTVG